MRKRVPRVLSTLLSDRKEQVSGPSPPTAIPNCLFQTAAAVIQMFTLRTAPRSFAATALSVLLLRSVRLVPWQLCAVFCNNFSLAELTAAEIAKSGIRDAIMTLSSPSDRLLAPVSYKDLTIAEN